MSLTSIFRRKKPISKTILITGAATGCGRGMAETLKRDGQLGGKRQPK